MAVADDAPSLRPFWSGVITFGLVTVPVALYAGVRSSRVSLRMLTEDGRPVRRRYVCPEDGEPVPPEHLVRGYEVEPDRFVVVEDEELEALAPERSREIDLSRFVPRGELDPALFDRPYVLAPSGETDKAYRLLAAAMESAGRVGIATFVMRGKEYLVAILAEAGVLWAETLRFPDELRTPESVGLPDPVHPAKTAVAEMKRALAALEEDELDREALHDRDAEARRQLAERKRRRGEDVVTFEAETVEAPSTGGAPIDLVQVLRDSLRQAGRLPPQRAAAEAPPLQELTKQQLYDRARQLDLPGRSGMSKDELVAAIRRAG